MELKKDIWIKKDYQEYVKYLISLKDETYKEFHQKLTITKYEILGIRVPMQRKIAKEISKGNALSFLSVCKETYYEEVNIEGFVIASLEEPNFTKYMEKFLPKIDNWAICDGFCNTVKSIPKNKEAYLPKIKEMLMSSHEFSVRVGLILLLSFYVESNYLSIIFECVNSLNREEYYINMAVAWLLAECYIKYREETLEFLKNNQNSKFVQNKTISKICDSYRVTKEEKEMLKKLRK